MSKVQLVSNSLWLVHKYWVFLVIWYILIKMESMAVTPSCHWLLWRWSMSHTICVVWVLMTCPTGYAHTAISALITCHKFSMDVCTTYLVFRLTSHNDWRLIHSYLVCWLQILLVVVLRQVCLGSKWSSKTTWSVRPWNHRVMHALNILCLIILRVILPCWFL